ncbi:MAG: hypothetical protein ACOC41_05615, partial [Chitinivibrionales bacterium]
MRRRIGRRKAVAYITALTLLLLTGGIQRMLTAMRPADSIPQSFAFLPDNRRIAPFLLGFHTTYAAYIWIETILYFGSHVFTDRQFPYLLSLV